MSLTKLICTEITGEDFRGRPMWIVNLSDGTTVYQSDDDPRLEEHNSWLCLKKHVEQNNLYIKDMILRFRDHVEVVGSNAEAYFFVHMILGNFVGYNQNYFNAGILDNGLVKGYQWTIPEIITLEHFEKDPEHPFTKESLIRGIPVE